MARNKLLGMAGILGLLVLTVYGCPFLSRTPVLPPEELARQALATGVPAECERAAVRLAQMDGSALVSLREVFEQSRTPEVRAAAITGLATQWDYESMPKLLDAMDDESPVVRARAVAAVQTMMSLNYDYNADAPPEARQEIAGKLRETWELYRNSPGYRRWAAYLAKKRNGAR